VGLVPTVPVTFVLHSLSSRHLGIAFQNSYSPGTKDSGYRLGDRGSVPGKESTQVLGSTHSPIQ